MLLALGTTYLLHLRIHVQVRRRSRSVEFCFDLTDALSIVFALTLLHPNKYEGA